MPERETTTKEPRSAAPQRTRFLLLGLGVLVVGALASLPWQKAQWDKLQQLKKDATLNEARLKDLKTLQSRTRATEQAAQSAPEDLAAQLAFANTCVQRGDNARALETIVKLEARPAPDAALSSALSRLYQRMGWLDKALFHAQAAVQSEPESVDALLTLTFLESHLGWLESARVHLKKAQALAPSHPGLASIQALMYNQMGALAEVEKALRESLAQRPDDWPTRILLARNQMAEKRFAEAIQTLDETEKLAPGQPAILSARVEALYSYAQQKTGGDPDGLRKALEAGKQYAALSPDSVFDAHYWLGRILLAQKDEAGAMREWEAALASKQSNPTLEINYGQLLVRHGQRERGEQLIAKGRASRALDEQYNRLIGLARDDFNSVAPHRELALFCQREGRLPRAIIEWEQVLRLKPGDPEATAQRTSCLALRLQAVTKAKPRT